MYFIFKYFEVQNKVLTIYKKHIEIIYCIYVLFFFFFFVSNCWFLNYQLCLRNRKAACCQFFSIIETGVRGDATPKSLTVDLILQLGLSHSWRIKRERQKRERFFLPPHASSSQFLLSEKQNIPSGFFLKVKIFQNILKTV